MKEEVILSRVNFCSSCSLEKENAELLESCRDKDRQLNNWFLSYNEVIKENAELKKDKEWLDNTNNEQTEVILKLNEQIEKMKNFYNCSHSSRALCPNEHKCNGCKDWELAE